jgi:hypothetical protein
VGKGYGWGEWLRVGKRVKGGKKGRRVNFLKAE